MLPIFYLALKWCPLNRLYHKTHWQVSTSINPFLESKFLHWTFWPSTVFTKDAALDLVKLFKTNKQLQDIMQQTKIWATEEIILPTLTRLLGYEIALNPCSYNFVQYQKDYSPEDIFMAMNTRGAYWIHPVTRNYADPIRKSIREKLNQYVNEAVETNSGLNQKNLVTLITNH